MKPRDLPAFCVTYVTYCYKLLWTLRELPSTLRLSPSFSYMSPHTTVSPLLIRNTPQFSRRLSVADLAPNMSNVSVYGQVVSVCVPAEPLPAVLPSRPGSSSANQRSLSQPLSRQLARQPPTRAGGVRAVEIVIGDSRGEARVLCCGREAALDALRCR